MEPLILTNLQCQCCRWNITSQSQRSLNKLPRLCIFISSFVSSIWFIGADVVFLVRLEGRLTARGHTIVSEKAEVIVSKEDGIDLSWPCILAAAESRQTCQVASASPIGRFKSRSTCREKSSPTMRECSMSCVAAVAEHENTPVYIHGLVVLDIRKQVEQLATMYHAG